MILLTLSLRAQSLTGRNSTDYTIPDNPSSGLLWVSSPVTLSGAATGAQITSVSVSYDVRHTYRGDLKIWLTTEYPAGTWHDYTLRDRESSTTDATDNWIETKSNLTFWNGANPNQTWYLVVHDKATSDTGYISDFSITVNYSVTGTVNATLAGISGGASPQQVQFTVGSKPTTAALSGSATVQFTAVPLNSAQQVVGSHQTTQASSVNPWQARERWVDEPSTFTTNPHSKTFTRNLPYATSGVSFPAGSAITLGQAATPRVVVRNDSGNNRNVTVEVRLSRTKDYANYDYRNVSAATAVSSGTSANIDLAPFTPAAAGSYYAAYKVTTSGLTNAEGTTAPVTDTGGWGGTVGLTVADTTVNVTLAGVLNGASPEQTQFKVGAQGPKSAAAGSATVSFNGVALSAPQQVVGTHRTTLTAAAHPWPERERWVDEAFTFTTNPQNKTFVRNLPYCLTGVAFPGGSSVSLGQSVTPRVTVKNDSAAGKTVTVEVRLSRTKDFTNFDYRNVSAAVVVSANSSRDVDLASFIPAATGGYYAAYKIVTTGLSDVDSTTAPATDTGRWGDTASFTVSNTTLNATLAGVSGGASPEQVQFTIGAQGPLGATAGSATVQFTGVPFGVPQQVVGTHRTTLAAATHPWTDRERWVDEAFTLSASPQSKAFTRNLPYAANGVLFPAGASINTGQAATPRVNVRNDTAVSRTVTVEVRLSRTKDFTNFDYRNVSAATPVNAGATLPIDLAPFTPTQAGSYYAAYKITTSGLSNVDATTAPATDTGRWGDTPSLVVGSTTVNATLAGVANGAAPEQVQFKIGTQGPTSAAAGAKTVTFTGLPLNTAQQVIATHQTTQASALNPWQVRERWVDESDTFSTNSTDRTYARRLPYGGGISFLPGNAVTAATTVTPQVTITNPMTVPRNVTVQLVLSKAKSLTTLEYSQTTPSTQVPAAIGSTPGTVTIPLPVLTPAAGTYYAAMKVVTTGLTSADGTTAPATDTWGWGTIPALSASDARTVQLVNVAGSGYVPAASTVQWTLGSSTATGNPAQLPLTTGVTLTASQSGATPWQNNRELWFAEPLTSVPPSGTVTVTRNLPIVSGWRILDPANNFSPAPTESLPTGHVLRLEFTVKNNSALDKTVRVTHAAAPETVAFAPSPALADAAALKTASAPVLIPAGGQQVVTLQITTPAAGNYWQTYLLETQTEGQWMTTDSSAWSWRFRVVGTTGLLSANENSFFFGDSSGTGIASAAATALAQRVPVIVIHGRTQEEDAAAWNGWSAFLGFFNQAARSANVKVYRFVYRTTDSIATNGSDLARLIRNEPGFAQKRIVLLGYSMGGLVARAAMTDPDVLARIERLVTIATPHLGSPLSVPPWITMATAAPGTETPLQQFMVDYGLSSDAAKRFASALVWGIGPSIPGFLNGSAGDFDLGWAKPAEIPVIPSQYIAFWSLPPPSFSLPALQQQITSPYLQTAALSTSSITTKVTAFAGRAIAVSSGDDLKAAAGRALTALMLKRDGSTFSPTDGVVPLESSLWSGTLIEGQTAFNLSRAPSTGDTAYALNKSLTHFTIQTDADVVAQVGAYIDTVVNTIRAPAITSPVLPAGALAQAYSFTVTASGVTPITFSATGLPAGLTLNPSTGVISGTPTAAGDFNITITASNGILPNAVQSSNPLKIVDTTIATPVITPAGGNYVDTVNVTMTCATSGATIRYTQDGREPDATSAVYAPFALGGVAESTVTVKARAFKAGAVDSATAAQTYHIVPKPRVAKPTITPNGGTFASAQSVTLATTTAGATLRYTLDGSTPTVSSAAYANSPLNLTGNVTVKAKGFLASYDDSAVASADFVVGGDLQAPMLAVIAPADNSSTGLASISVNGTATDAGRGDHGIASVTVNGVAAIGGTAATSQTANWSATVPLNLGANSLSIVARDSFNNEAQQIITVSRATVQPVAEVRGNNLAIAAGDTTPDTGDGTDFGTVATGTTVDRTFTIANIGSAVLNLTATPKIALLGTGASAFSIVTPPAATVPTGGQTSFVVRFAPTASAAMQAEVSIPNDDPTRSAYLFSIRGTGSAFAATHTVASTGYTAGGTVTVSNTLTFSGQLSALGWDVIVPAGWAYVSGTTEPTIKPAAGDLSLLTWNWTTVPTSPVTFTYTLSVPAGTTGEKAISAIATVGQSGNPVQVLAKPDPLAIPPLSRHDADTNGNSQIEGAELTRLIQLYNARFASEEGTVRTGCYQVQPGTIDGFVPDSARPPDAEATLTRYHSADTNRNGKIDGAELTRVIQLFNTRYTTPEGKIRTGYYKPLTSSVDGFTPDPERAPAL